MARKFKNNASSKLLAGISSSAVSFTVESGKGDLFPACAWPDYFSVTLEDASKNVEIIQCVRTAASDTINVVDDSGNNTTGGRAKEGTTARAFSAGDVVELRLTAAALDNFAAHTHTAADIANTPAGNIAATTVQAALNELDSDKQAALGYTPVNKAGDSMAGTLTLSVSSGPAVNGTTSAAAYGLQGRSTNASYGGVIGTTADNSKYGILGHNNAYSLYGNADIYVSGNITAYSDINLKTNIETIPGALDKVRGMRGVSFDRIDSGRHEIGVIAQEMQLVCPEVVQENPEYRYETAKDEATGIVMRRPVLTGGKTLSVAYGNLAGVFIEAIKELNDKLDAITERVNAIELGLA